MGEVPGPKQEPKRVEVDLEVLPDEWERWEKVAEQEGETELRIVFLDTVEMLDGLIGPGDRFALHPSNFYLFDGIGPDDEEVARRIILSETFNAVGFDPENPEVVREYQDEEGRSVRVFRTGKESTLLGYDGTDFWLELEEIE